MSNDLSIINLKVNPGLEVFEPFGDAGGPWGQWMECFAMWLEQKRQKSGGPNTVRAYTGDFRQCFSPQLDAEGLVLWQPVPPWEMNARIAVGYAAFLAHYGKELRDRSSGKLLGRESLSRKSVNRKLAALASFYTFAKKHYGLWPADKGNPFKAVERGEVSIYDAARYPEFEEAEAILSQIHTNHVGGKRDLALLYTILTTCRRSNEILNLRWGDLQKQKDGWGFRYRYKGGKVKRAVLGQAAYTLICEYLKADGRLGTMGEKDYIFVAIDEKRILRMRPEATVNPNQPISNSMANKILKKYAQRAGVDLSKAHIHGLRHAGSRERVAEMKRKGGGVDYGEIMDLLGHSSLAITQVYVKSVGEDREDPGLAAAEAAFLPKGGKARRVKKPAGEQMALLTPEQEEIARLKARLAELEIKN